ncbi:SAM-dependent DNA methyltransferase [Fastidiosipila sanguinis]|uniref:site-specific DNA-methyltransferase (adenine-specific) n=2 Tax=Fastidiosipila sanguinis TaxID=236753 RepID=A0A2S0KP19_9FIRM|nr:SAM-dependent DNA methyltransferase [Fastidiosipila sanguinis]
MSINKEQIMKTTTLTQALWNSADVLRGKMDANEYKNYTLGIIFYKFLSDQYLEVACDFLGEEVENLNEAQAIYEQSYANEEEREDLLRELKYKFYYTIEPNLTYIKLMQRIHSNEFLLEELDQAFRNIEQSNIEFENLFADVDLMSRRLGATPQKRNETISAVMRELEGLNLAEEKDNLGDAYEYLIGNFASEYGKKAGEFYTPQPVSNLMAQIAVIDKENKHGLSVYEITLQGMIQSLAAVA